MYVSSRSKFNGTDDVKGCVTDTEIKLLKRQQIIQVLYRSFYHLWANFKRCASFGPCQQQNCSQCAIDHSNIGMKLWLRLWWEFAIEKKKKPRETLKLDVIAIGLTFHPTSCTKTADLVQNVPILCKKRVSHTARASQHCTSILKFTHVDRKGHTIITRIIS